MITVRRSGGPRPRRPRLARQPPHLLVRATTTTRSTWASAPLRVINEDRVAPGARLRHARPPRHGDRLLRARGRARAPGQPGQRLGHPPRRRAAHERRHRRHAQRVQRLAGPSPCTSSRSGSCPSARGLAPELRAEGVRRERASAAGCAWSRRATGATAPSRSTRTRTSTPTCSRRARRVTHTLAPGRHAWVQVARGARRGERRAARAPATAPPSADEAAARRRARTAPPRCWCSTWPEAARKGRG